jgi:ribose/xylose/arabinose/galactoside ABC-type transport system permease subunit
LLGEIDLSIAYMSAIAGVVAAKLQLPDGSHELHGIWPILVAIAVAALI